MQNKKLLLLAWLIVFPMCLFAQTKEKIIKVACIGNSITEGFALEHPETESYPAVLQRLLGDGASRNRKLSSRAPTSARG